MKIVGIFIAVGAILVIIGAITLICLDGAGAVPSAFFGGGFGAIFYAIGSLVKEKRRGDKNNK